MKFIKDCQKLTKEEQKQIVGGNAPYCPVGKVCYFGEDSAGNLLWKCVPLTTSC
jgi:hypothetical protein